jgi:prevent-host-death family protein
MIDLKEIHPLTDFQRNTKAYLKRLKETGRPQDLTVNGRAEVVVQDAAACQVLLDAVIARRRSRGPLPSSDFAITKPRCINDLREA